MPRQLLSTCTYTYSCTCPACTHQREAVHQYAAAEEEILASDYTDPASLQKQVRLASIAPLVRQHHAMQSGMSVLQCAEFVSKEVAQLQVRTCMYG